MKTGEIARLNRKLESALLATNTFLARALTGMVSQGRGAAHEDVNKAQESITIAANIAVQVADALRQADEQEAIDQDMLILEEAKFVNRIEEQEQQIEALGTRAERAELRADNAEAKVIGLTKALEQAKSSSASERRR